MFVEMYAASWASSRPSSTSIRRAVMDYAVGRAARAADAGGKLGSLFRRRRALNGAG